MYGFCAWVEPIKVLRAVPNNVHCFFVVYSIKYAVTSKYYEVVLFANPEGLDLWSSYQDTRIATVVNQLGLYVTKRPAD